MKEIQSVTGALGPEIHFYTETDEDRKVVVRIFEQFIIAGMSVILESGHNTTNFHDIHGAGSWVKPYLRLTIITNKWGDKQNDKPCYSQDSLLR